MPSKLELKDRPMSNPPLDVLWHRHIGDCYPAGWDVKWHLEESAIRLHNFLDHRWPDSEQDRNQVRDMHTTISKLLFNSSTEVEIFYWEELPISKLPMTDCSSLEFDPVPYFGDVSFVALPVFRCKTDDGIFDEYFGATVDISSINWGEFAVAVASDDVGNVIISNCKQGVVYAPYDGGIDIVARDATVLNKIASQFEKFVWRG